HIYIVGDDSVEGCLPFVDLMTDDGSAFPKDIKINPVEDVAVLPYSSGTTGLPKGVMLTHHNLIASCEMGVSNELIKVSDSDAIIWVLPLFHLSGILGVLLISMKLGITIVTLSKFEPKVYLGLAEKHKVTCLVIAPPIAVFLIKHPMVDEYNLSSVDNIICGAAPLGAGHVKSLQKRLNNDHLKVRQGYGMTETAGISTLCGMNDKCVAGSVGGVVAGCLAKVIDIATGKILGIGRDGELCFRGPQVMKGYLNNEAATKSTIIDGWIHTGDIGHYDAEGNFFIVDRFKELIKFKAFQVAPAELEDILLTHPEIQDAAVIGVPDEYAGELPKAIIVSKTDTLTAEDVVRFIDGRVASYKQLRGGVEIVKEVPKSPSGKILRKLLRDRERQASKKKY
ncbi:uncharacterized protein LOC100373806, partial [Saccoglossus kowalevskii]|uniref:4-coumarate--CoA ligase 1-like n=1 Tax=Saccoglossus kowalevskii TaxID=10224 RepID=A0ABM0GN07_SACKO